MTTILGTSGKDVIVGTTGDDTIYGGDDNDRINGGAGDDILFGEAGNDTLTGDAGNDTLYGGDGNDGFFGGGGADTLYGEAGDDVMYGDGGNDVFYGGTGNNTMYGGTGDDVFYVVVGTGANTIIGGSGNDTVVLEISSDQLTAGVLSDLSTLNEWMADQVAAAGSLANQTSSGSTLTLANLQLTLSVFEHIRLMVDGIETPVSSLLNHAPVATPEVSLTTAEDTALVGSVGATDADGDALGYAVASVPAHGSLSLDAATGQYTYTPDADYHGTDTFDVNVSDDNGGDAVQSVIVSVTAVNDAPLAEASVSLSTVEDAAVSGWVTANDIDGDILNFSVGAGPANGTLSLDGATGAYTYRGAENYSGSDAFDIVVADGNGGQTTQHVDVTISAVADAPHLAVSDATVDGTLTLVGGTGGDVLAVPNGPSMQTFDLTISSTLTDTDGSETLSITIADVPAGATLSAGTANGDGSWSLTGAQLSGLKMTSRTDADFALSVTAAATEAGGGSTSVSQTLHVTFTHDGPASIIDAGSGNDTITGSAGDDVIYDGGGNDRVSGGDGNDTFMVGSGNDSFNGGAGSDTIDFSQSTSAATVDLSKNYAVGSSTGFDSLSSIENITGSSFGDSLTGTAGDNVIDGGDGNDIIQSGSGNDTIYDGAGDDSVNSGSGNDIVYAGAGNDTYNGGQDFDTLSYASATSAVTVDANSGTVSGFANDSFSNFEQIIGSAFDDSFLGSKGDDIFVGGAGDDQFRGMGGSDTFTGGLGSDTFTWAVKDLVSGKKYLGLDTITDFSDGEDTLDLSAFTAAFASSAIDDIVKMHDTATGTIVSVKVGSTFYDLVMLQDVHGITANSLLDSGSIIA